MVSLREPTTQITTYSHNLQWTQYFDRRKAIAAVVAHIKALPSNRTPEKHTMRVYTAGLKYFGEWIGDDLPTEDLMQGYIAHLKDRGLKSSTIGSKYLAPARLYLRKLASQQIDGITGPVRDYVSDCRHHINMAREVKTPRNEETSNVGAAWRVGVLLEIDQVNAVLRKIDRQTLTGKRDYALLMIGFSMALRIAEIARITLNSITWKGKSRVVTVRGKRNNIDPVTFNDDAYEALMDYVNTWNDRLEDGDDRRIQGDIPVWQGIMRNDQLPSGKFNAKFNQGLSTSTLSAIVNKRSKPVKRIAPHDMRRAAATIGYDNGMSHTDIQQLLRHKNGAITWNYIRNRPDYESRDLTRYVQFG